MIALLSKVRYCVASRVKGGHSETLVRAAVPNGLVIRPEATAA